MAFVATPGCVRVDIQFVHQGQQVHNIIWCKREAAWTDAQRDALASAIEAWWNVSAKTNHSNTFALVGIEVVNQDAQNSPATVHVVSPASPGTLGTAFAPSGTALCATLRTDLRGRSYRGRMYLGGLPGSAVVDPIATSVGYIANLIAELVALKDAIEALGAIWVIVSKFVNHLQRAAGLPTAITAISMDQYFDSQRRRLGLRGV